MTAPPNTSDGAIRKAAVLVRSLDPDSVATLLARLLPAEAKAVRAAVRELDEVSSEERAAIIAELRGMAAPSGVEFELSAPAPARQASPPRPAAPAEPGPLNNLGDADTESLVACLAREQPRTVAVVLSCLSPRRAADVLSRLPEERQALALDCLAGLGEVDPDSLNVIAAEVEAWIGKHAQEKRRREDRMAAIRAILEATAPESRARLEADLTSRGRWANGAQPPPREAPPRASAPAERPIPAPRAPERGASPPPDRAMAAPPRFTFSQLESLDPKLLATVFARVDSQTLILALVGASDRLMRNIQRVASRPQARALRRSVASVGPVRLSDIRLAQQAVARAAAEALAAANRQPGVSP